MSESRAGRVLRRTWIAATIVLCLASAAVAATTMTDAGRTSGPAAASEAQRERAATRTAFRSLSREEAIGAAKDRHPDVVMTPAWRRPTVAPNQRLDYVSDHAARLTGEGVGSRGALVVSPTPLRARDEDGRKRPVDLSLETAGDALRPANPLTPVVIGRRAGDGASLTRSGVRLVPDLPHRSEVSVVQDTAFFPNVSTDVDYLVKPTPGGFESSFHVRSEDSAERFTLRIDGGAGRTLSRAPDGQGVLVEDRDGEVATISAPKAWDAERRPVELAWRLDGERMAIDVAHRGEDYAYPLLVDPAVSEWYDWERATTGDAWGDNYFNWVYSSTNGAFAGWAGDSTWLGNGLYVRMLNAGGPSVFVTDTHYGQWTFRAPGTSKVWGAEWNLVDQDATQNTCLYVGIRRAYDPYSKHWESCSVFRNWYIGQCYPGVCQPTNEGAPGNAAVWGIRAAGSSNRTYFAGQVGVVYVHLYDDSVPTVTPPDWTNAADGDTLLVEARDAGLGIDKFRLWREGDPLWVPTTKDRDIDVTGPDYPNDPCLRLRLCPASYMNDNDAQHLPEGKSELRAFAEDPAGNRAGTPEAGVPVTIKRDRQVPAEPTLVSLPRALGAGTHNVAIRSADIVPNGVNAVSGVRQATLAVDGEEQVELQAAASCTENCVLEGAHAYGASPTPAATGTDSFTDTAGKLLENHAPAAGGAWIRHASSTQSAAITGAGRVRRLAKSPGDAVYTVRTAPTSADYDVAADVHQMSLPDRETAAAGVVGRVTAGGTSLTAYAALYYPLLQQWRLVRFAAGAATTLATYPAPAALTTARVTLRLRGPALTLLVDGTVRARAQDAQITTAGSAGLLLRDMTFNSDTSDVHLDQFAAQVPGVAEGRHQFALRAVDGATNARTANRDVIVDRTPPLKPTATGAMRDRAVLGGETYPLQISGTDAGTWPDIAGIDRLEVRITGPSDGGVSGPLEYTSRPAEPTKDHSDTYTFDGRQWQDGTYTVSVLAYDAAKAPDGRDANPPAVETFTVTVNRQGPTLEVTGHLREVREVRHTDTSPPEADIVAGGVAPIRHIKVWLDPAADGPDEDDEPDSVPQHVRSLCPASPGNECETTYTLPPTTAPGEHHVLVRATDDRGNASKDEWDIVKHSFPPIITGVEHDPALPDGWVASMPMQVTVDALDIGTGIAGMTLTKPTPTGPQDDTQTNDCGSAPVPVCPNPDEKVFAYDTGELAEGYVRPFVRAFNSSPTHSEPAEWLLKVDRSGPVIDTPDGVLWDRRDGREDDQRFRGLYDRFYDVSLRATDGSNDSPASRRSGTKRIDVTVRDRDGQVVVQSEDPEPQDCPQESCEKTREWTFDTDSVPADGEYTIEVRAVDQIDNASEVTRWEVTVDRRGDIYQAAAYTADPDQAGEHLVDEWAQPATASARVERFDHRLTLRPTTCNSDANGCLQRRLRTTRADTDPAAADTYVITTGTSVVDARLVGESDLLEGSRGQNEPADATGPLLDVVDPWQVPPPAHGTTYEMYEDVEPASIADEDVDLITRLYVDATTKLPVRRVSLEDTVVVGAVHYTYAPQRRETSEMPADFFALGRPAFVSYESDDQLPPDDGSEPAEEQRTITPEERLGHARAVRREFGFPADAAHVQALLADPSTRASIDTWSAPMTAAEDAELTLRADISRARDEIDDYTEDLPTYAGSYLSHDDGRLHVGFTGALEAHEQALEGLFSYPDRLVVESMTYTRAELQATRDQISADWDDGELDAYHVATLSTDERENRVVIGINPYTEDRRTALEARYGGRAVVRQDGADEARRRTPVRGGAPIYPTKDGGRCTAGFTAVGLARRNGELSRQYFKLTAGHCAPGSGDPNGHADFGYGVDWTDARSRIIGHWGMTAYPAEEETLNADAGYITLKPGFATSLIVLDRAGERRRFARVAHGSPRVRRGDTLCWHGSHKDVTTCGEVTATDYENPEDGDRTITQQVMANVDHECAVLGGDSGAPTWVPTGRRGQVFPHGILTARADPVYHDIANEEPPCDGDEVDYRSMVATPLGQAFQHLRSAGFPLSVFVTESTSGG